MTRFGYRFLVACSVFFLLLGTAQSAERGGKGQKGGDRGSPAATDGQVRRGGGGGGGKGGGKGGASAGQIMEEADSDGDGELSGEEFQKYIKSVFARADRSGNNKLDAGELAAFIYMMSPRPQGPGGQPLGGGPGGAPGAKGAGPRGPRGGFDLMQFDANNDGKISKDEAPQQLADRFDMMDSNGDGFIDKGEVDALRERFGQRGGGGKGAGGKGAGSKGAGSGGE